MHRLAAISLLILSSSASAQSPSEAAPEGLSASDWSGIRQAHEAGRHAAEPDAGGYRASNPGQQWSTHFDGRGFTTQPDAGGWTWGLELVRYGFAGHECEVTRPEGVSAEGQRVAYDWDTGLREWYVNDARGLEHGYTVQQRPSRGAGPEEPGPLSFVLALRGELSPEVQNDGRGVRFVNGDGAGVLTYSGLTVFDADGRTLPAHLERVAEGLLLSVDERGARYPLTIDPIAQQAYLKASNTDAADNFGNSISVSGDTVVVGALYEDSNATGVNGDQSDNTATDAGAAYVFVRSGTTWSQQAYLKASNTYADARFGGAVAVSGDTIVVGASRERSASTGVNGDQSDLSAQGAGAAYVFVRNGTIWSQQAYLKASSTGGGFQLIGADFFGGSVAVSGDTIVVGAPREDSSATGIDGDHSDNSAQHSGAAYVFVRSGTTWSPEAYLKASNTDAADMFGYSVAVSGDTIVVGAWLENSSATGVNGDQSDNTANSSGGAYVFRRSGTTWSQEAYLKASNTDATDWFGAAVSVSGDTVVVGAYSENSSATGVNGDQSDNSATNAGAAYVFRRSGTTWSQEAYLKSSNTEALDYFGAVALSGDTLVVGAVYEDSNATGVNGDQSDNTATVAGAAYVFRRSGTTWSQEAYLKSSNTEAGYYFGAVAVSGDTIVVGARGEGSGASGVNGDQSDNSVSSAGAAYVFGSSAWTTFRNSGSNPASYSASAPALGSTWTATVDLTTTGHTFARVLAFRSPADLSLSAGQTVLVGGSRLFRLPLQPGPQATWSVPIPNDPSIACVTIHTQAIHILGVTPFALSNALDLFIGN